MTSTTRTNPFHIHRHLALAVAALVTAAFVLAMTPAQAQKVVGHDPEGDAESYDIAKVSVQHRTERVRFRIDAYDQTPYFYNVFIDTPGGKPWKYVVSWAVYWPHKVWVLNRKQYRSGPGSRCELRSARELMTRDVTFSVPVRCFKEPYRLRVRVKSYDDQTGWKDRTNWTPWARRG
jgi:hypothetical protein